MLPPQNMPRNLSGMQFGRLKVIEPSHRGADGRLRWKCQCDCIDSTICYASANHLTRGHKRSCGCLQREASKQRATKHGLSSTRIYRIWRHMRERCYKPKTSGYRLYGARGIQITEEWLDPSTFIAWAMNNGYSDHLTIERIDVNGNYEPSNCCWIPISQQAANRRNNVTIQAFGEAKILSHWAEDMRCRVAESTLQRRLINGWEPEKAIQHPSRDLRGRLIYERKTQNAALGGE